MQRTSAVACLTRKRVLTAPSCRPLQNSVSIPTRFSELWPCIYPYRHPILFVHSFVCFPPPTCGLGLTLDPTCTPSRLTTQRSLRQVSVVACEELNAMSSVTAITSVIKRHGIFSLYDGVLPMAMRRSLDWGIRFYVSTNAKNMMPQRKREQGLPE